MNNPKNEHIFNALGIEAISSTTIICRMIEEEATIGDIRTLMALRKGNMAIVEIELPTDRCVVCNKQVASLNLPPDCVLVALIRGEEASPCTATRAAARRRGHRVHQRRSRARAQEGADGGLDAMANGKSSANRELPEPHGAGALGPSTPPAS